MTLPICTAPTVRVTLPLKTVSEANRRDHYHAKAARVADHRGTTLLVLRGHIRAAGPGLRAPYVVTLTRIAKRDLDDDNLRSALKATRDGVADALGIDDGSDRVEWRYAQRRGKPGDVTIVRGYGVQIEIRHLPNDLRECLHGIERLYCNHCSERRVTRA